jgi:tetratricopeptide (TPR) repeat protein
MNFWFVAENLRITQLHFPKDLHESERKKPMVPPNAQLNPNFEPLEFDNLPCSLDKEAFIEFLKRQARKLHQDHHIPITFGLSRALNVFSEILGVVSSKEIATEADDQSEASLTDEEQCFEVFPEHSGPAGPSSILSARKVVMSPDNSKSSFHWTISPSRFILKEPHLEPPTLSAVQSLERVVNHEVLPEADPLHEIEADITGYMVDQMLPGSRRISLSPNSGDSTGVDLRETTPGGTEQILESRDGESTSNLNPNRTSQQRSRPVGSSSSHGINASIRKLGGESQLNLPSAQKRTKGLAAQSSSNVALRGSLHRSASSSNPMQRLSIVSTSPLQESDSFSSLDEDKEAMEEFGEGENSKSVMQSMENVVNIVLEWPGLFDLHKLNLPSEEELFDDNGQLKDNPELYKVENFAFLCDPSLPSPEICFDIWKHLESKAAPKTVTLFWLAKAGRIDEVMAILNQELLGSPPLPLYLLSAQLKVILGKCEEALNDLEQITKHDRLCAPAWALKARLYFVLGPVKACIHSYNYVLKVKPKLWRYYLERGNQYEVIKEVMYAFEDYKVVRQLNPDCLEVVWRQISYYMEKELFEDALNSLQVILEKLPNDSKAIFLRGKVMCQLKLFERAFEHMNEALRIDPYSPDIWTARGCLLRQCNMEKAVEDFSISLLLDDSPKNADAILYRGHLYYNMQKYELAYCDWIRYSEMNSTAWIHLNLGIICMQNLDDYVQAMQFLDTSFELDPLMLKIYMTRAELFELLHQESFLVSTSIIRKFRKKSTVDVSFLERATREYSKAIHLYPQNYILFLYRGRLLLRQKYVIPARFLNSSGFFINAF